MPNHPNGNSESAEPLIRSRTLSPLQRTGVLVLAGVLGWIVMVGPAFGFAGPKGVEGLTWSGLICLVPGLPVVWAVSRIPASPVRIWLVVGGAGLRFLVVILAMVVMRELRPDLRFAQFHVWLGLFYNLLLFVEMYLLFSGDEAAKSVP